MQVGSFSNSNLPSGTALLQNYVIRKVGSKHLTMNLLAAVHFAQYFSFAVIMSEIRPTDHKSLKIFLAVCHCKQSSQATVLLTNHPLLDLEDLS